MKTIILNGFLLSLILLISCGGNSNGDNSGGLSGETAEISLGHIDKATQLTRENSVIVLVNQFNNPNPVNSLIDSGFKFWDGDVDIFPEPSPATISMKTWEYFSKYQFSDNETNYRDYPQNSFQVTIMDRMVTILCGISYLHAIADFPFNNGYPADGNYRTTVTSQTQSQIHKACGSSNPFDPGTYDYLVETVDGSSFDKKITFIYPSSKTYYFGVDINRFYVGAQEPNKRTLYYDNKIKSTISFEWIDLENTSERYLERVYLNYQTNQAQVMVNDAKNDVRFTLTASTGDNKYSQLSIGNDQVPVTTSLQVCLNSNLNPPSPSGDPYNSCPNIGLNTFSVSSVNGTYSSLKSINPNTFWNCINENSIQEFNLYDAYLLLPSFLCFDQLP